MNISYYEHLIKAEDKNEPTVVQLENSHKDFAQKWIFYLFNGHRLRVKKGPILIRNMSAFILAINLI